jgi:hypothetical protein
METRAGTGGWQLARGSALDLRSGFEEEDEAERIEKGRGKWSRKVVK